MWLPLGDQVAAMHQTGTLRGSGMCAMGVGRRRSQMRRVPSMEASRKVVLLYAVGEKVGSSVVKGEVMMSWDVGSVVVVVIVGGGKGSGSGKPFVAGAEDVGGI